VSYETMATSVLGFGENAVFASKVSRLFLDNRDLGVSGTLMYTSQKRVVFVTEEGVLNKKYNINHNYSIYHIANARVEKRILGTALAVDAVCSDGQHTYRYEGITYADNWVAQLNQEHRYVEMSQGIIGALKSRERTSFHDINTIILNASGELLTDEALVSYLQKLVAQGSVEGFVDPEKKEFVHMTAYQQKKEVIQYTIAASFSFASNGALEIKCPNCSASQEVKSKEGKVVCSHCGKAYIVPERILNLL
jgi:hypothetical protein